MEVIKELRRHAVGLPWLGRRVIITDNNCDRDLPMSMDTNRAVQPTPNTTLALVVYVLYFIAYFAVITAPVGVIIAHTQVGSGGPLLDSHYRFQIRTFWIGILYVVVGFLLTFVLIGYAVLLWWFIWSLIRNIKGVVGLTNNQPIPNPASWMFG